MTQRLFALVILCSLVACLSSCDDDDDTPAAIAAPVLNNASAITATGFTITWTAVTGADSYLLDVSTANTFATTLTGYDKKQVSGTTTSVTGLTANTKYYFRLYTKKGSKTSPASTVKDATTTN